MKNECIKWRSSIRSELLTLSLKKGGLVGGGGALLLLLAGIFLPLEVLKICGIPIFFSGMLLIAFGLFPYRHLNRLQLKPHEIHYDGQRLLFLKQGKPFLNIKEAAIESLSYQEKKHFYGIHLRLCDGNDFFLPYFSERTCNELKQYIDRPLLGTFMMRVDA